MIILTGKLNTCQEHSQILLQIKFKEPPDTSLKICFIKFKKIMIFLRHQARANTKTDVPPRPRRPPPDTVPKTINNSNQDTYE